MSFSLAEIVEAVQGKVVNSSELGDLNHSIQVERLASLGRAKHQDIAFFFSKAYQNELPQSDPGILITAEPFVIPIQQSGLPIWKKSAIVSCLDPQKAMAVLSEKVATAVSSVVHPIQKTKTEIHPTAQIHPTAELADGVQIGAFCVIDKHAKIGAGTILYPYCFVGPSCSIGENCVLFPNVVLYEWTQIGHRVRIHAGCVIGADGFGYIPEIKDQKPVGHRKIYHLGRVVIADDVEIGANTCIDRATFEETRVDRHAKIDNDIHIGHNCIIEEGAIICGGAGLAGHAHIGKYAYVGGLAGISNQVYVGDGGKVGAMTLCAKDVKPGEAVVGNPQRGHREHFKIQALMNKLLDERRKK